MSSYNLKLNFIYVHIPKTAGTSMEAIHWVGKGQNKHEGIDYFAEMSKHTKDGDLDLDRFWKWCFVRDPYTRFMSGVVNHVLKGRYIAGSIDNEIEEIEKFAVRHGDGYDYPGHAAQSRETGFNRFGVLKEQNLYTNLDDKMVMDFVGKFENLKEDWDKVCDHLEQPRAKLPHKVRGFHKDYDRLYTDKVRNIVADYYGKDFELFDYEIL